METGMSATNWKSKKLVRPYRERGWSIPHMGACTGRAEAGAGRVPVTLEAGERIERALASIRERVLDLESLLLRWRDTSGESSLTTPFDRGGCLPGGAHPPAPSKEPDLLP
jgi:hypothetical protein